MEPKDAVPDHEALKEILSSEGAPPRITLDVGGSADLNGDGIVTVELDDDGELVFKDA
uniref:Minor tail protein n=1 Tax=Micrococcus phage Kurnik TaxID=3092208 RepID=A0AAU6R5H1_9CAUD